MLVVGTLAYAASYFARGWLAGHQRFGLFGGLVLMESMSRICFALAVALGIASGQTAVALGIAAAPLVSLVVVPAAFARSRGDRAPGALRRRSGDRRDARAGAGANGTAPAGGTLITVDEADAALAGPGTEGVQETAAHDELSLRRGGGFAVWVSGIMLSEQTLLERGRADGRRDLAQTRVLAGIVFNVLLIARAPLQLFQAIQTSLLPHLTGLEATAGHEAFARAIRVTMLAIAAFAAAVALGLLVDRPVRAGATCSSGRLQLQPLRPGADRRRHGPAPDLGRAQPGGAGARPRAGRRRLLAAARRCVFLVWMLTPAVSEQLLRAEIGYAGATALLALAAGGALPPRHGCRRCGRAQSETVGGVDATRRSRGRPRRGRRAEKIAEPATNTLAPASRHDGRGQRRRCRRRPRPRRRRRRARARAGASRASAR